MKISEHRTADGTLVSFEIGNIGRSRACGVIERALPSASVRRQQSDDFGVFELNGRTFFITEPWGDSSRYLVHQEPAEASEELETLRRIFENERRFRLFSGSRSFGGVLAIVATLFACIAVAVALLS